MSLLTRFPARLPVQVLVRRLALLAVIATGLSAQASTPKAGPAEQELRTRKAAVKAIGKSQKFLPLVRYDLAKVTGALEAKLRIIDENAIAERVQATAQKEFSQWDDKKSLERMVKSLEAELAPFENERIKAFVDGPAPTEGLLRKGLHELLRFIARAQPKLFLAIQDHLTARREKRMSADARALEQAKLLEGRVHELPMSFWCTPTQATEHKPATFFGRRAVDGYVETAYSGLVEHINRGGPLFTVRRDHEATSVGSSWLHVRENDGFFNFQLSAFGMVEAGKRFTLDGTGLLPLVPADVERMIAEAKAFLPRDAPLTPKFEEMIRQALTRLLPEAQTLP